LAKILGTHQISAAVIELIEETRQYCYLVSPYIKMWHLLDRALAKASEQDKRITVITRAGSERKFDVRGFEVVVLNFLHTKLYVNERSAIVSSINLYDTSSTRNHELALHFQGAEAKKLKQEIIDQDLLATQPVHRFAGKHTSAQQAEHEQMLAFRADLQSKGYCVACGVKIDFDGSGSVLSPTIIRCRPCWAKKPWVEAPFRYKIQRCHYCGESLESVLSEPYHHACSQKLRDYNRLAS
jgi:hypothetical protein